MRLAGCSLPVAEENRAPCAERETGPGLHGKAYRWWGAGATLTTTPRAQSEVADLRQPDADKYIGHFKEMLARSSNEKSGGTG